MTKPDPIAIAKSELADAIAQRDLAQQNENFLKLLEPAPEPPKEIKP